MGMVLKRSKIIRIGRGGLDHVEKRLMRGSSPKRISQSVKRVNASTADPHTTRTESSIAHALVGVLLLKSFGVHSRFSDEIEEIDIVLYTMRGS